MFLSSLISISLHLILLSIAESQEDLFAFKDCYNSDNYSSNSQYQKNLNALLPLLASKAVANINSYSNAIVGRNPNRIYGFSQCMSEATQRECSACFNRSRREIVGQCPMRMQAIVRYDYCILHYSNESFFFELDRQSRVHFWNFQNVSDPNSFSHNLGELMTNLSRQAAQLSSKLAVGSTRYGEFEDVYGLAQCTRDLNEDDCFLCLSTAVSEVPTCCSNKQGGRVYGPSCNIRFETYPFYPGGGLPPPSIVGPTTSAVFPHSLPRMPSNSSRKENGNQRNRRTVLTVVICMAAVIIAIIAIMCLYIFQKKSKRATVLVTVDKDDIQSSGFLFDLNVLKAATNSFSDLNKLGQGGFCPVYKGKLPAGEEIAVKRLQTNSTQGIAELRKEVHLVAELQHRNLVKLLGCCIEEQEKLIVYEYVPNASLDKFIFDPNKRIMLNWCIRYKIIKGVARGLLYLHEDSSLRIIHRDMKASNILLDIDMNPKISDFGLAKIFGEDDTHVNTSYIAGTYGYMAPEYAMKGQFSTKSDVFSFGVLVLEIVTGRHNSYCSETDSDFGLISTVWRYWVNGMVLDLMDEYLGEDCQTEEILRCFHLGLLCVQEKISDRPPMSLVHLILNRQSMVLPVPSHPAFLSSKSNTVLDNHFNTPFQSESSHYRGKSENSVNEISITELHPR